MAGGGESTKAVLAAMAANAAIAVAKFAAFLVTGASSLLAESVHSVADTGNQALLLLGGKRAKKDADELHPFGYGRERYFWAFVVAIVLFTLGSVFAVYEGIHKIQHPEPLEDVRWAYAVLAFGILVEGLSFRTAVKQANEVRGRSRWTTFIRNAKAPELPVVILEDAGALIGLVIAMAAVTTAEVTGVDEWDGIGTLAIGVLLGIIAIVLVVEMKSLLIGESATRKDTEAIRAAIEIDPAVRRLIYMRTQHHGPRGAGRGGQGRARPHPHLPRGGRGGEPHRAQRAGQRAHGPDHVHRARRHRRAPRRPHHRRARARPRGAARAQGPPRRRGPAWRPGRRHPGRARRRRLTRLRFTRRGGADGDLDAPGNTRRGCSGFHEDTDRDPMEDITMAVRLGDEAPDFTAETTEGTLSFHEWKGDSWAVLFSHPKDFTPVCTTELGRVAALKPEFDKRDTKVIGLSVDDLDNHSGWGQDIEDVTGSKVNFPMIADTDRKVSDLYDMIHPNADDTLTVRSVFIVGPDNKVKLTLTYPASTGRNFDELLRVIDSLQLTADHKVATPADWKDGEDVIIAPAVSDEDAKERFPDGLGRQEALPPPHQAALVGLRRRSLAPPRRAGTKATDPTPALPGRGSARVSPRMRGGGSPRRGRRRSPNRGR